MDRTVLGLELDTGENFDCVQPLVALVVVKGLDSDGKIAYWACCTRDLMAVEAYGMAGYGAEMLRRELGSSDEDG